MMKTKPIRALRAAVLALATAIGSRLEAKARGLCPLAMETFVY